MLGIIGGTGLAELESLIITKRRIERTPYGEASQPLVFGELCGHEVVFLARHGLGHTIPPHAINYRANIWALHAVGVTDLLAVATVGGIDAQLSPGDIVLPHQIIDYTHGRKSTYYDGVDLPVKHIDFTEPYSAELRSLCQSAAINSGLTLIEGGVYAAVQGPRLETAAEINRLERDGATLVGMTGMPEAALARELGLRYTAICPVANHAAGRGDSHNGIQYENISATLNHTMQQVRVLLAETVKLKMCAVAQ
ncbi:MAG: S-methyl-5'-thioinosine phosphorylase [Methylotenera sp.]|nr:S-methyl-5'-thioinosine phosphorylase [Methylotenera sp.]